MDSHHHLSIAHYFLLVLLTSSYMQSTTKTCFCLAGGALSSSVKTNPCIDKERQALLIFKQHLVDPSGRLSSWVGHDCCQWKGVSCNNRTGHVVKMDLRNPYEERDMYEKFRLGGFWGVCGTLILKTSWRSYATVNKVSAVENTAALKAGLKSMEKQKGILCSLAGKVQPDSTFYTKLRSYTS
ncbi:hypothetical protein ACFX16_036239 [Malus domestica]